MKALQYEEIGWINYLNFDMSGNDFVPLSTFVQTVNQKNNSVSPYSSQ
jgi:hypothetical protein